MLNKMERSTLSYTFMSKKSVPILFFDEYVLLISRLIRAKQSSHDFPLLNPNCVSGIKLLNSINLSNLLLIILSSNFRIQEAKAIGRKSFLEDFCKSIMVYFFHMFGKYFPFNMSSKISNSLTYVWN